MEKLIDFTLPSENKLALVLDKITGITSVGQGPTWDAGFKTFISTGPDNGDGENGWYVAEQYEVVRDMLEKALGG